MSEKSPKNPDEKTSKIPLAESSVPPMEIEKSQRSNVPPENLIPKSPKKDK